MPLGRLPLVATFAISLCALVAHGCATGQTDGDRSERANQERFVEDLKRDLEQVPEPDGERVNGRRDGRWTFYFPDGQPRAAGAYEHGQRVGKWTYFMPDGSPLVTVDYGGPQFGTIGRDYHVDVTDDSVARDGWPAAYIALELNSHDPGIQRCYVRLLKQDSTKRGVVRVRFIVAQDATVETVEFLRLDDPLDTAPFRGCIKAVFSEMHYLPMREDLTIVKTYHLDVSDSRGQED